MGAGPGVSAGERVRAGAGAGAADSAGAGAIAVVVPTRGDRDALDETLRRLARQREPGAFEVLLAADATVTDLAPLEARLVAAGVPGRVVRGERPGASAARNAGWRESDAELVLFLDDDVWAGPELLAAHRSVHATEPTLGVGAIGRLRFADTLTVTPFMRWVEAGLQFDTGGLAGRTETGWWHLYTCNCSLKRAALAAVGGLDEVGFPFGYEDLDLGLRLDRALPDGLRLRIPARAEAEHFQPDSLEQWRERVGRIARSERRFVARYPELEPHFHTRFSRLAGLPAPRGRAARLVGRVPRWTPWLGPRVQSHARLWWEHQLAAPFLRAWEEGAGEEPGPPPAPDPTGPPPPPEAPGEESA